MTNNYKDNILDYVVNNVTETSGSNVPLFDTTKTINITLADQILSRLQEEVNASSFTFRGYVSSEISQMFLIYGTYIVANDSTDYGYIYLCDKNLEEISLITTFTSGTKLFPFIKLKQENDGTFYALTGESFTADVRTSRVILLNNIFAKQPTGEYQVRLRASYIVPNSNIYDFTHTMSGDNLAKDKSQATYYLLGAVLDENGDLGNGTALIKFTINVGMENEWEVYKMQETYVCTTMLLEADNDTSTIYIHASNGTNRLVYGYTIRDNALYNDMYWFLPKAEGTYETCVIGSIKAISRDEVYVTYTYLYANNDNISFISKLGRTVNDYKVIDTFEYNSETIYSPRLIYEGGIMFTIVQDDNDIQAGIIRNDILYLSSKENYSPGRLIPLVSVSYNLVNIYTKGVGETIKYILDYNPLNYNGLEYSNYNQTLAVKARLNSNGEMVFARNLYNTTLLGNIATSNLQVPNTLLNDVSIVIESLVGATNSVLINDSTPITKNIYETLYVNFIRSISVIDEDTDTTYPNTAAYINQNVNTATKDNCESSFIGKVGVVYSDNTIMQNINWKYVTDHYETEFVIDATNEVPTLTFMSNDETTMYITKELDLTVGKYYLISQKLRIE